MLPFHYPPDAGASEAAAIEGFGQERLKELAQQLVDNPTDANVIVGHSSGSAIADELAEIAVEQRDKPIAMWLVSSAIKALVNGGSPWSAVALLLIIVGTAVVIEHRRARRLL